MQKIVQFRNIWSLFKKRVRKKGKKTIILFLWKDLKHPFAGGGIQYSFKQAEHWNKEGYQTIFLTPRFKGSSFHEIINGSDVFRFGGKFSNYIFLPLLYIFFFKRITDYIVDIENGIPYFSSIFSAKPKILLTYHLQKEVLFKELPAYIAWFPYLLEVYVMPFVYYNTKVVTISKNTKEELIGIGFRKKNITISYCGFDINKNKFKSKYKKPTILYLGRIEKYKRVSLLISLFERLNFKDSELIIAGSGRDLENVKKRASVSPLKDRIKVLGRVSDEKKVELFAKSWVCGHTSIKEGWGITVIEGNYYNTPSVAFNVEGLKESIIHEKTGLLSEDKKEFEENLRKVLSKEIKFKDLKKYASQFSWESCTQKTLQTLITQNTQP
jgi:glycosyltransferase involved in cell wall biosynthesis